MLVGTVELPDACHSHCDKQSFNSNPAASSMPLPRLTCWIDAWHPLLGTALARLDAKVARLPGGAMSVDVIWLAERIEVATATNSTVSVAIAACAHELTGAHDDYDLLIDRIGATRFVLLGEATHGTQEFYDARADITRRLIEERGFNAVAVEADWPDAYRANRYVRGVGADASAERALSGFKRFPAWMWRNTSVVRFLEWLHAYNSSRPPALRTGFYGLDLYSLYTSIEAVLEYLDKVDPDAAQRARQRYACFERFDEDAQQYAYATAFGMSPPCEQEVLQQLQALRNRRFAMLAQERDDGMDEHFYAEQNARLVANTEQYYRTMFRGRISSWNLRDRHMAETLDALDRHLSHKNSANRPARFVVWAHNSHLGDARATDMGRRGKWNLGQLARERHPGETRLIGFTTHHGTVTAASDWGGAAQRKRVRPALPGSYEKIFHQSALNRFLLPLGAGGPAAHALAERQLERAIGVLYLPESERASHYFHARLPAQFDAVLHLDETTALEPLERSAPWQAGEVPETYPVGV